MTVVGIIAEYNPFHNGHLYQLREIRRHFPNAVIVVVMSGNFLERGEPACVDKWTRAKQALVAGVNLVIELPVTYCVQPADRFAEGAIKLLQELQIDYLAFGAEHASYDFLAMARKVQHVHGDFSRFNESYAAAYQRAVTGKLGYSVEQPNDLLGLAYAKAILINHASIKLYPLQRVGAAYHEQNLPANQFIASASSIRRVWKQDTKKVLPYLPIGSQAVIQRDQPVSWEDFWPLLRYQLIVTPLEQLRQLYDVTAGVEYRMQQQLESLMAVSPLTFETWLQKVKTKRYTYTHLSRLAVVVLLQLTNQEVEQQRQNPYLRVLGFDIAGQNLLHQIKKTSRWPLITKISQNEKKGIISSDYKAGRIYATVWQQAQDLKRLPIILNR
ncbi:nucleotidyltransferase [Liquorilactobacillus nagelii]|uniref:nucleotidyltransferase n=1 Tax=Liquorilactobacillus nagelii TaxID=82688 RepID=UPI0039EAAA53